MELNGAYFLSPKSPHMIWHTITIFRSLLFPSEKRIKFLSKNYGFERRFVCLRWVSEALLNVNMLSLNLVVKKSRLKKINDGNLMNEQFLDQKCSRSITKKVVWCCIQETDEGSFTYDSKTYAGWPFRTREKSFIKILWQSLKVLFLGWRHLWMAPELNLDVTRIFLTWAN